MPLVPQDLRIDYGRGQLLENEVAADPMTQFGRWFDEAVAAKLPEPNAMTLATADSTGFPSARIVLLKGFDHAGFTFFTNYESRKGQELAANPRAALCFYWQPMERQVRVEGSVERVSREESETYFRTRPQSAQVGAWASRQSRVIPDRTLLEAAEQQLQQQYADKVVPLPEFWGGYRVVPSAVEFWLGRPSRLHDRIRYTRESGGTWHIERLSP
jgi:pyridoxamine 5'-phosphate oxidase